MTVVDLLATSPLFLAGVALAVGLIVGSFLNVVIHRVPIMLEREWARECANLLAADAELDTRPERQIDSDPPSCAPAASPPEPNPVSEPAGPDARSESTEPYNLVVPRSRCPHCDNLIRAWHNIPVVSYLALGGKCAHCRGRISPRYPLVEALTAVVWVVVVVHFGFSLAAAGALALSTALIVLTFIDLDRMLLPDNITLPWLWLGLAFNLQGVYTSISSAVLGAIAGYMALWLVFHTFRLLTGKEGMGYGDFKLTAMLGAWLGWQALPGIVLISSLVGAVVGIALIALGRHGREKPIPFGPFLAVAGWLYLMWGTNIDQFYTQAMGFAG